METSSLPDPAFSVVIPSYNRKECLLRLLDGIYRQQCRDFEIIVVDDASSDDTVEAISRKFPNVRLLVNEVNSGPCVTRNRGITAAKGQYILGFDSDVSLADSDLFGKVQSAFKNHPSASGFAFRIFSPDGLTDDSPRWWHPKPIKDGKDQLFESDYFSGTAYAFSRETMVKAGLFPTVFYMHYEEVELAYRILDQGGTIIYDPSLTAIHHESKVAKRSRIQKYYKPRNQILLAASCFPKIKALRYLFPRMGYQLLKAISGFHLPSFFAALWDATKILPGLWPSRNPLKRETLDRISELRRV
jgi:GT2 family glycosyltransferase